MDRAADLRADYDRLGVLLAEADAKSAASIARERRLIGAELEGLETQEEVPVVDQLASRRRTLSGDPGVSSRRRKSG